MDDVSIFKSYLYKKKKITVPFYHYDEINLLSSSESMKHPQESLKCPVQPISASSAMTVSKKTMENSVVPISNQDTSFNSVEPYYHAKLNSVINLKDSTRKLLCLLEDIQTKTVTMKQCKDSALKLKNEVEPAVSTEIMKSVTVTDGCVSALQRLEHQTDILQNVPTQKEEDDCSVFKRLTRKCNCLNKNEYNDFVINFNEKTKYFTNTTGEIIKNLRILKRFLYMGGGYCKHALKFLNEGLDYCSYSEKVEITQGCVQADMCNVFEDASLVIVCISWPFKYDTYGDSASQESAAAFINKLAQFEEGRRYLLYTSKITRDIKKVLRKKFGSLSIQTLDLLEATLDALCPKVTRKDITDNFNNDEGYGSKIINELKNYRKYMTSYEITTYLNLLYNYSCQKKGITELTKCMNPLVEVFQAILIGYDDSKMNIIITKVLNNLVNNTLQTQKENERCPKILTIANVGTEAVEMKNKGQQSTFNYQVSFVNPMKSLLQEKRHKKKSHKIKGMKEFASRLDTRRVDVIVIPKEEKRRR